MNNIQKNFIFLSQLIKIPVIDTSINRKIGRTLDIAVSLREMYPRASALILYDSSQRKKVYIPWKNVRKIAEDKAIFIENSNGLLKQDTQLSGSEILLKETFWDKQIVDISGSKVVRVNDLHLLREGLSLWLVHVDIGLTGLIRRLGWLGLLNSVVKLICSCELEDRFISWKQVQPITSPTGSEALYLKTSQARLSELHPADLAEILTDLGTEERIAIFRSLDYATAAQTFQQLAPKVRVQIAALLKHEHLVNIINEMATDEIVDLLSELSQKKVNLLLSHLPAEKVSQISSLRMHPKRTAGSIMNTEFITAKDTLTASIVLDKIKNLPKKKESIYYIYVLDNEDNLAGVVTLQQLLTVPGEKVISEFMRKRIAKVKVTTNIKDVAEIFYKYDFTVVPVVDKQNKIQGIITMKDAFESVFHQIREGMQAK